MAASKLFSLLGPAIVRTSHNFPPTSFTRNFLPPSLHIRCCSSPALAIDSDDNRTLISDHSPPLSAHPWPEWVHFVDRLLVKGYLAPKESERDAIYSDMNVVKDGCLNFARNRFDILKSLSTPDIHTVVAKGCPNLFRKAVNSGKRLRAYVDLDESDVCASCNLRESCDRAYVMLNDSEAAARTVDIVRILLIYALDPLFISGEKQLPGRELVEASVKKLLSELTDLSETAVDPELPKPAVKTLQRKKVSLHLSGDTSSRDSEMKPGDWVCSKCNFMNFARNIQCRQCDDPCNTERHDSRRPSLVRKEKGRGDKEPKKGDWTCSQCLFMNFASKKECFRCRNPRPPRRLENPGDWECPCCDFVNFARNAVCKKCNSEPPHSSKTQSEEHSWRKPY